MTSYFIHILPQSRKKEKPSMNNQSEDNKRWQRLRSFASLNWYEETIKFIFSFVTKTSELLLAAGIVISTANFLTDGDVMSHDSRIFPSMSYTANRPSGRYRARNYSQSQRHWRLIITLLQQLLLKLCDRLELLGVSVSQKKRNSARYRHKKTTIASIRS